eukprot:TRINITY_DN22785_c0_g1_i1.p1 TRINITY_DN22785_c0_g1~~TRINITY_DN22785_c0_g1_i1.p1  ORF type:complete len:427 (-),score=85.54 TRINITY_DN22785_c0_g1_i1:372-1652(-)
METGASVLGSTHILALKQGIRPRYLTPNLQWQARRATKAIVLGTTMGSQNRRASYLSESPYVPPHWAKRLHPIPSHVYNLAHLPTPIHRWNLPGLPDDIEVWIKRDDLSGMQLSGNKVRKLEFLMADAKEQGADCVITIGGIQSNHCRATAVAARYMDLDCYLLLRASKTQVEEDPGLVGNLLVERMIGANIELVSKEEYARTGSPALGSLLKQRLIESGRKPYVIPVGGSNSLGTWGYIEAAKEIEQQLHENAYNVTHFDDIVMACGSGGTTAGLSLGSYLSSIKAKVHAYAVCDDPDYFYNYIQGLLDGLNAGINSHDLVQIENAKGLGYAMSKSDELKCITEISNATGIVLDPVYGGKAAYHMLNDMKENPSKWKGRKVLFIHTGGLFGMFDKVQQLQPLIGKTQRMKVDDSIMQDTEVGKMF